MPALSFQYDPSIGPLLYVLFAQGGVLSGGKGRSAGTNLLVDTGASITCISPELVRRIGLRSLGKKDVGVASGRASLNTYLVDVMIPFGDPARTQGENLQTFHVENIQVMEYRGDTFRYQGLLGRDIIDRGIFMMAGWDRKCYFSI